MSEVTTMPLSGEWTADDLDALPEDGLRYELVDGVLLVSPVEVLSPSTRATDLTVKRRVFEDAAVPSYWLLDTEVPSLTVLELFDGAYLEVAVVSGDEALVVQRPFPLRVVPAELMR